MKLLILSDLHLEFHAFEPPKDVDFDVVILAGDIHDPGTSGIEWAWRADKFGIITPVVMVAGNHEYYDTVMTTEREAMQVAAAGTNVRMLDGHEAVIDGVRFLGCTLSTDFAVHIEVEAKLFGKSRMMSNSGKAMKFVEHSLTDYQLIMMEDIRDDGDELEEPLMPIRRADRRRRGADTLAIHQRQRAWLKAKLEEPFDGATVVVTHHAPHRGSLSPRHADDWSSAGFVNELPAEFFKVPVLWVHGHTHQSFDYQVGNCRVVCNPRGYVAWTGKVENREFDAGFVVVV